MKYPNREDQATYSIIEDLAAQVEKEKEKAEDAEAYYNWWLSKLSIDDYVALQRQTHIEFS